MQSLDYKETLLSQYANSTTLKAVIASFSDAIKLEPAWVVNNLLNPDKCPEFILRKIAERYGLGATLKMVPLLANQDFIMNSELDGYAFATPTGDDGGTFDIKQPPTEQFVTLQVNDLRKMIDVNARRATSVPSIANLNKLVWDLFAGRGNCFLDISMIKDFILTWKFTFLLTNQEKQLIQNGYLSFLSGYDFRFEDNVGA